MKQKFSFKITLSNAYAKLQMRWLSLKISDKSVRIILSPLDCSCYGMQHSESFKPATD